MKNFALFAVLAALTLGATAGAREPKFNKEAVAALSGVPAAEMPAVAARLISQTPKEGRVAALEAVVKRTARTNPSALRHVVAAVAKAEPSLAARAAGFAAKANPEAVGTYATAAASAAPSKAAEILALCSSVTVTSRAALAEFVAQANPAFSATTLSSEAATVDVTADAAVVTGGTIITPIGPAPGSIGEDLNGNRVNTAPGSAGTGSPGADPDRYATAGS